MSLLGATAVRGSQSAVGFTSLLFTVKFIGTSKTPYNGIIMQAAAGYGKGKFESTDFKISSDGRK